jgi:two-component system, NarL family, nitrate/nitrite sensor histidine kinase NarX
VKHSSARSAWVHVTNGRGRVSMDIRDNGIGFDSTPLQAGHYGLESMRSRAAEIGATLSIESAPGHGTIVRVEAIPDQEAVPDGS